MHQIVADLIISTIGSLIATAIVLITKKLLGMKKPPS